MDIVNKKKYKKSSAWRDLVSVPYSLLFQAVQCAASQLVYQTEERVAHWFYTRTHRSSYCRGGL